MAAPASNGFHRLRGHAVVRDADEAHRSATPLELFFDLTFVVAVARAATALHHELAAEHVVEGVVGFLAVFFTIWWAWMNATWFASAHDADDVPYRLLVLVQMAGVLVLATGVTDALEHEDWLVVTIGYAIMRGALIVSWLRVARDQPAVRTRCVRYAVGIGVLQVLWFARLLLPSPWGMVGFVVLVVAELAVPAWAERASPAPIFHPEHIEERYGLFTIIVLGESVLSAAVGFQTALDDAGLTTELLTIGVGGLVGAFCAWWLYFDHPGHLAPTPDVAFRWGYAHIVIFGSLAATGAGLHVATEAVTGHADARIAALAVAVPVAAYLLGLALVLVVTGTPVRSDRVVPKLVGAAIVLAVGALASVAVTVAGMAVVMLVLATLMIVGAHPAPRDAGSGAVGPPDVDQPHGLVASVREPGDVVPGSEGVDRRHE